jgi:enamine deaminase RidA (YjgF/YER057c/UK114 family)
MTDRPRFFSPETIAKPTGYTHVVEVTTPSRLYYISGQLGRDLSGKLVGAPGDFEAQAVQTFENLKATLIALGAEFSDVIKLNNYLTQIRPRHHGASTIVDNLVDSGQTVSHEPGRALHDHARRLVEGRLLPG